MRLLPATLPDAPPMEEWPLESPTERDYWKHWLVPVIWPALSEMTKELPLTSPEQAAMAASEMMPIAVVAAQLYLGTLLQRSQPALPSVTKLSESVISSLRKMPLVYPPNYVEQLSKQPGPLKLATAIALEAIHKRLQSLIAELSSRKA